MGTAGEPLKQGWVVRGAGLAELCPGASNVASVRVVVTRGGSFRDPSAELPSASVDKKSGEFLQLILLVQDKFKH